MLSCVECDASWNDVSEIGAHGWFDFGRRFGTLTPDEFRREWIVVVET